MREGHGGPASAPEDHVGAAAAAASSGSRAAEGGAIGRLSGAPLSRCLRCGATGSWRPERFFLNRRHTILPGALRTSSASGPTGAAAEQLLAECYRELRVAARRALNGDAARLLVQPTELRHEASIRLMRANGLAWRDRTHIVAIAARVMRQVLVDELRANGAAKRGGGVAAVTLRTEDGAEHELLALDAALERLRLLSEEKARIVELRVFGGMTVDEIARTLDRSPATVKRGWRAARAWLHDALGESGDPEGRREPGA